MNVCKRMQVLLTLRPGDRNVKEKKLVKAHLAACPDCVALDRAYTEQRRLVRNAPHVELTPLQRGQLLSRIQYQRRRNKMFNKLSTVLSMAIAVVVVLTLGFCARSLLPSGMPAAPQETFIWQPARQSRRQSHRQSRRQFHRPSRCQSSRSNWADTFVTRAWLLPTVCSMRV